MLTHPVQVIVTDCTLPLDQLHGHENLAVLFVLTPGDSPDELRRYAAIHIAAYYDKYASEQFGKMSDKGFRYNSFTWSRSK